MEVIIKCEVDNNKDEKVEIILYDYDLEELIERKAKELKVKPKPGRLWSHYSPSIKQVCINQ